MSCKYGYRGDCCCECEYQYKIHVCNCGHCPTTEGYVCIAFHIMDHSYHCTYMTDEHGMCELFTPRKQHNQSLNPDRANRTAG